MSSEVDICNLALGYLGDTATVASISPPEQSAQAQHCARFYPIARDSLQEMHTWGFCTKRVTLAAFATSEASEWDYAYASPSDMLNAIAVLPPDANDDYTPSSTVPATPYGMAYSAYPSAAPTTVGGPYAPQPFSCETNAEGVDVIYSDQQNAVLRYSGSVTDTGRFSPLFVTTLAYYLASFLAGPLIKGNAGDAAADRCLKKAMAMLNQAKESDAGQRRVNLTHRVAWVAGR